MFYIKIKANKLLYWYSKITGTRGDAKAGAFYPFLLVTDKISKKMEPYFINHELIHFAQQKEMLFVGAWLFYISETIYLIIIKRKKGMGLYLARSAEKEAYENMFDLNYLKERKPYSHIKNYFNSGKDFDWNKYVKKIKDIEDGNKI